MVKQINAKDFLVGAAIGGVIGTVAALLAAPKSGKKLRENIYDTYCDVSDKTHDIANRVSKKGKSLARSVGCCSNDWTDRAMGLIEDIKSWVYPVGHCHESTTREFILGGVAGGILGAVAALLLAPKPGAELREDLTDAYEDVAERTQEVASKMTKRGKSFVKNLSSQTNSWLDIAQDVLNRLTEETKEGAEELADQAASAFNHSKCKNVADWVSLGFRVLQHVRKRG